MADEAQKAPPIPWTSIVTNPLLMAAGHLGGFALGGATAYGLSQIPAVGNFVRSLSPEQRMALFGAGALLGGTAGGTAMSVAQRAAEERRLREIERLTKEREQAPGTKIASVMLAYEAALSMK